VDHTNLARIREEALETQDSLIVEEEYDRGYDKGTVHLSYPANMTNEPSLCHMPPLTLSFADGWKALKNALTDTERQALSLALQEGADIKAFAVDNGIMLEVLADNINEKATDCIGDSILEVDNEIALFDEYRENIQGIVG
jgi:hypothetical protein